MSILSVKNLSKSFGKLEVLNDISFNVEKGEVILRKLPKKGRVS